MQKLVTIILGLLALAFLASDASAYSAVGYGYGGYSYGSTYGGYGYGSLYGSYGSPYNGYGYGNTFGGNAYGGAYGAYGQRGNVESYNSSALDFYNRPERYNPYVSDFSGYGTAYNFRTARGLSYSPYADNRNLNYYGGGYGSQSYGYGAYGGGNPYGQAYGYNAAYPYIVGGY